MMHLQIKAYDPQDLAEILDALAVHLRDEGASGSKLLVTGIFSGVQATADISWEVEK